ncbi:MAG: cyclase family protein [Colwellia sp.]|nr:cyclase family protein [Colwellia sp.]
MSLTNTNVKNSGIKISIELQNASYQISMEKSWSLAIPVNFNQPSQQPNHFSANAALSCPMQAGGFIGDTKQGGSCNVNELTINPHCNGTHTESIAHICDYSMDNIIEEAGKCKSRALTLAQLSLPALMPCAVISITPKLAIKSGENYSPEFDVDDLIISCSALKQTLASYHDEQLQVLVIRTLPNTSNKRQQAYNSDNQPVFFSREAILYLNERGVEHLVVDVPSIDRLHDDGLMTCHHLFWQVDEGSHQVNENSLINKTITEMAFIGDEVDDDFYFINIQTPAFHNDAAPSRPVLFSAKEFNAKEMSK